MKWFMVWMLGGVGAVIATGCLVALMLRGRIRRRHRVKRSVPTKAPLWWLVHPGTPARLHRRLAKVGSTAESVAEANRPRRSRLRRRDDAPTFVTLADHLVLEAVRLDDRLVTLAGLSPQARRSPMGELGRSVAEAEAAAARLVAVAADAAAPRGLAGDDPELTHVADRLDRLAAAQDALGDLDAQAGLTASGGPAGRDAPSRADR